MAEPVPIPILTREETAGKINDFAGRGEPFLFAIDFEATKGFVLTPEESRLAGVRFSAAGGDPKGNSEFRFLCHPVPFERYQAAFNRVMYHLKRGDSYLLNLTFATPIETNLDPETLFDRARAPFRLLVPGRFLVFSPEPFVKTEGDMIFSHPMKGTIDASLPDAEQALLSNEKELFEHNTIVDLIRNDLSMVATGITVDRFRYIDRIRTHRGDLLQASSRIAGHLPAGWQKRLGDLLFTLLPAGSVTGAPKESTVRIIREAEPDDRGFYTGIFGRFDGKSLVSAVSIRFIDWNNGLPVFRSGGGITALSRAEDEYDELVRKIYLPV